METVTRKWNEMASRCLRRSADRQTQINKLSNIALHIVSEPLRRILTVQSTMSAERRYPMTHSSAVSAGSYWLLLLTKD